MRAYEFFVCYGLAADFRFARSNADPGCTFLDQGFGAAFSVDASTLFSGHEGFVNANKELTIKIMLEEGIVRSKPPANHDPKTATGMVGIENLGATCYLNALLQVRQ